MKEKKNNSHPDRDDLIRAARSGSNKLSKHLKSCPECRELYELLQETKPYRELVQEPADGDLVARCAAIPALEQPTVGLPVKRGRIAHDSWSEVSAMALRDIDQGGERRLRLSFGTFTLELVAQRYTEGWQMSARLFGGEEFDRTAYILRVGRRKIASGEHCMFVWSDLQPPRSIELITPGERYRCPAISWRGAVR